MKAPTADTTAKRAFASALLLFLFLSVATVATFGGYLKVAAGATGKETTEALRKVQQQLIATQEHSNSQYQALQSHISQLNSQVSTLRNLTSTPAPFGCPQVCLDAVIPYHNKNAEMLVHNGGLASIRKHVKGLRTIYIVSASNETFTDLLTSFPSSHGPRVLWFDEARMPFKFSDFKRGWLFQQTLKMWAAQSLPGACPNVMIIDSDNVFIQDFHPVSYAVTPDGACIPRFKYIISTKESGATIGDIDKGAYHDFTQWLTGHPKPRHSFATAIGHWQIMQRDVLDALTRSLRARYGYQTLHEALLDYTNKHEIMTEYEAYFAFAWYFYQERMDVQEIPFLTRKPALCKYGDETNMRPFMEKSIVVYFTCHQGFYHEDYFTNCKGREHACNPGQLPQQQTHQR